MKHILNQLYRGEELSRKEAASVLQNITQGEYDDMQVAAFLSAFNMRSITKNELQGFRDTLLHLATPFDVEGMETIDIVGTGGDGKNTFNISTLSAIVVAGAGYKVTKHGSYGVSSSVGSSDVLMALGYEFTNDTDILKRQLDKANICFLHAPLFHPAMKKVVPIRKALKIRTFFNMLGPLVNPVQPTHQLLGVSTLELGRLYQYLMEEAERKFSIIYSLDGYDEISLTGAFQWRSNRGEHLLLPQDLGLYNIQPSALFGGDTAAQAAAIFRSVLEQTSTEVQKNVVLANAGLAIHTIDPSISLLDCIAKAKESIESGNALNVLKQIV